MTTETACATPIPPESAMTIPELEAAVLGMEIEVRRIEAQLGDGNRTDDTGQTLPWAEWVAWRRRAVLALNAHKARRARLKLALSQAKVAEHERSRADQHRRRERNDAYFLAGGWQLLRRLQGLVRNLEAEGVDLSPDEAAVVAEVQAFIDAGFAAAADGTHSGQQPRLLLRPAVLGEVRG